MKDKNAVAMAVAIACASPLLATAKSTAADAGHWEVMTPMSVNESAPWLATNRSHLGGDRSGPPREVQTATAPVEVVTPLSVDESAPWLTAEDKRIRPAAVHTRLAGMPNPHTPWSPNESGSERYSDYVQTYSAHVESVDQARIYAATPYPVETVASGPLDSEIDRLLLGASETPQAPREPDSVAVASPALVDSRQPGLNDSLQVEPITSDVAGAEQPPADAMKEADRPIETAAAETEKVAEASPLAAAPSAPDVAPAAASAEPAIGMTSGGETQSQVESGVPMR